MIRTVKKHHCDGFTLVEVLIALTLTAVLVGLLFEALHTYAIANSVGYAHVQAHETASSLRAFMRKQLREIVPLSINTSAGQELFFRGEAHTVSYSGRIPSHRAPGGLYRLSFVIEGSSPDQSLTFRYARIPDPEALAQEDIFDFSDAAEKVMVESATSMSFEYFGVEEDDADAQWLDNWQRHDQIPEMVRIRIQARDSELESILTAPVYANLDTKRKALRIINANRTLPLRRAARSGNGEDPGSQGFVR
ncbi:MAG: general secretion pathway protein J [Gammaproteobacteria bacterium]|jgi:general secretion pathway protein J